MNKITGNKNNYEIQIIILLLLFLALVINSTVLNIILGVSLFIFISSLLINRIIYELAYFEVIYFICVIQMIILPLVNSASIQNFNRYLIIVIPGAIAFFLGTNVVKRKPVYINKKFVYDILHHKYNRVLAIFIIILGLIGSMISFIAQNAWLSLFVNFSGIGMAMSFALLYYNKKKYWIYPLLFFIIILLQGIITAVFASVIAFGLLCFIYFPTIFKLNKKGLLLMMIVGFLAISLFQNVKLAYRAKVWDGDDRGFSIMLFIDSLFAAPSSNNDISVTERASSGSTIALIYEHVPKQFPNLYGENLVNDLSNALLPRFLFPEKKNVDTRANYIRYTGRSLTENTSVGINIFGISYAEFGIVGSWIFLFLFGFLLNRMNNFLISIITKNKHWYLLIFILPVIFSSFFKFEQEFVGQFVGFIRYIFFYLVFFKVLDILQIGFKR
ncbi:hypothetical protein [Chryseobacterium sp. Leaf394]|uniref:hypothetical protein n=1 Tax=Chryseobacterium sp. Leaf394 TaxID=1736361 RepID=UPI0006FF4C0D|nr:hypothetical protein [Chryseobacterium sp. Leaf394]KQS93227.1 hypothetical protein ASG21_12645 [Chryseobacterium sp. Leaf394]